MYLSAEQPQLSFRQPDFSKSIGCLSEVVVLVFRLGSFLCVLASDAKLIDQAIFLKQ